MRTARTLGVAGLGVTVIWGIILLIAVRAWGDEQTRCPCSQSGLVDWTDQFVGVWKFEKYLPSAEAFPNPDPATALSLITTYGFLDLAHHTHNLTPGTTTLGAFPTLFHANPVSDDGIPNGEGCHSAESIEVFAPGGSHPSLGGNLSASCGFSCSSFSTNLNADFHFSGSFSIMCWARATKAPPVFLAGASTGAGALINTVDAGCRDDPTGNFPGYCLYLAPDLRYNFRMARPGSQQVLPDANPVGLNEWHHVAGRYQAATTQTLVVDGVQVAISSPVAPLSHWGSFFRIGWGGEGSLIGQYDTCAAVDSALTNETFCRLAVCGMDGCHGPCRCDPNNPTQYAYAPRHFSFGGPLVCDLPPCNQATLLTLPTITTTSTTSTSSTSSTSTSSTTSTSTSSTTTTSTSSTSSTSTSTSSTTAVSATTSTSTSSTISTSTSTSSTSTSTTLLPGISCTLLTANSSNTATNIYTTASVTPTGNDLILVATTAGKSTSVDTVTATGNSLTYDCTTTKLYDGNLRRITLCSALGASPTSGAITLTYGGTEATAAWSVWDCNNVNTSTPLVQQVTNSGTSQVPTVTLSAFGSTSNATAGFVGINTANNIAPGSGYTEISDSGGASVARLETEFRVDNDTSVDASTAPTTVQWGMIAVEINHQ